MEQHGGSGSPLEVSGEYRAPASLPGLDLPAALCGLRGKWSRLAGVLRDFKKEFNNAVPELEALLQSGAFQALGGRLHTLKGIAGMLSAHRLRDATASVEAELQAGRVPPPSWPEFAAAMGELLDGIEALDRPGAEDATGA